MKKMFTQYLIAVFLVLTAFDLYSQCNQTIATGLPGPSLCTSQAPIMCSPCYLDGYQGTTVPGTNTCNVPGVFCGSVENNQWYAFLAPASGMVTFNFTVTNCTGTANGSGIQAEIYSTSDCTGSFVSVSNCWSPGAAVSGSVTAPNLEPYCTYYLMIDGWAGDFCDFTINTTDCTTPPPPQPLAIVGPTAVCPGATVTYSVQPLSALPVGGCSNNSNTYTWGGIAPYGTIIGASDQPTITIQWNTVGATVLTFVHNNVCFGPNISAPLPVVITPIPPTIENLDFCLGECVECAGQLMCTPGLTPVTLLNWLGCDSVINCILNPIAPVFTDLGTKTICAPATFSICGETFTTCGVYSGTCDNYQGCDSTVIVDLAILNPIANIAPPGVLDCTPGSFITLNGNGSTLGSSCLPNVTTAYLWTGPAGGISGPANGPTVNVTKPGQYCLTVTHARDGVSCTNQKCVTVVKDDAVPQAPQVNGPNNPCPNTPVTYTATPVGQPTPTSYTWTTSNGTPITASGNMATVTWTMGGPVQICATAVNDCGPSPQTCFNVNVANPPVATISGTGSVCPGSGDCVNLSISLTGVGPWTVGYSVGGTAQAPLTIPSSPYTLMACQVGTYTLTSVTGGAGCNGTVNGSATVQEYTPPTATISGIESICQGSGQMAGLTVTLTGTGPWQVGWAVNGNAQASFTANASPYTLMIGQAQANPNITLLTVTDANGCDGTVSGTGSVTLNTAPTVTNVQTPCDAANIFFTVSFQINGGDPTSYSVTPANGTISPSGVFTSNNILSGNGYSFVVTDANNCNPVTVSEPLVICDCETNAGDMPTTLTEVCGNGPIAPFYDDTDEVLDANDVLRFVLHSGNSLNLVAPIIGTYQSPVVGFVPPMQHGVTYYLSAVVGDNDGSGGVDLNDPCLDVSQGTPIVFYEIPSAMIGGIAVVCEGENASLSVDFEGDGPFSISYDAGAGVQILNGITANPYTLVINAPPADATVSLTGMSDSHCAGTVSGQGSIEVNSGVTATATTACDLSGDFYNVTITISGGEPGSYFVTPNTGSLVGNVFTSNNIPSGSGYSFVVDDLNGCDPQTVAQTEVLCDCTSKVGVMTGDPFLECGNGPLTATYDNAAQVLDPDDILVYILHTNGGTQAGNVLATNPNAPTFSFGAGMTYGTTYYISAVVGNPDGAGGVDLQDPCTQVAAGTQVTFFNVPTANISGTASLCQGDSTELSVTMTGQNPWGFTLDGQVYSNLTSPDFTLMVMPSATTTYALTNFTDKNCPGTPTGSAVVTINTAPQIMGAMADCLPDTNVYEVVFQITGGNGNYTVLPAGSGTVSGGVFTSNPIASGVIYTYTVDDSNGCGPVQTTGTKDCNCTTDAGSMQTAQTIDKCVNEGIAVPTTTGSVLDGDDILLYYLHTGSGNQLGDVIATNTNAGFAFNPATMQAGVTYYISAVAGNNNGGMVDLTDFCLDVAPGTPVFWNPLPSVTIVGSDAVCEGDTATVLMNMSGVGPYNVSYSINGSPQSSSNVQSPFMFGFVPTQSPTTVMMINVNDLGAGCSSPASESAEIFVSQNVNAGIPGADLTACDDKAATVVLADQLTGEDVGGEWTDAAGTVIPNGSVDLLGLAPGTYTYTYTVLTTPPCLNDQASVNLVINPLPVADAGEDQALNCDEVNTELGGSGTTPNATYNWTGAVSNNEIPNPETTGPGTYTLLVTNQFGCTDSDEAVVTQTITEPNPHLTISGVSCFGDKDGTITIDSITSGLAPYLCSFNGGAFTSQKQFTQLSPGQYTINIVDAAGCERTVTVAVAEPEEVTVKLMLEGEFPDNVIALGDSVKLLVFVTPSFDSLDNIVWTPADIVSCDTCEVTYISPTVQTSFSVMVDDNGCTAEDDMTVFVSKSRDVYIPNAFSPNNDNTNDLFTIYAGKSVAKIRSFLVFNRWGETMSEFYGFLPNDPLMGWDGKHRGKFLNPGVFTWFAEIEFTDGSLEIFKGDVTLMR